MSKIRVQQALDERDKYIFHLAVKGTKLCLEEVRMNRSKSIYNTITEFILKPSSQCDCKNKITYEYTKNDTSVKSKYPDITREQRFWDRAVPS